MIPAKGWLAVFRHDPTRGVYVACEVIAWGSDGAALCVGRNGALVPARDHRLFAGLIATTQTGNGWTDPVQIDAWFRRQLGLASDAPLSRPAPHRTVGVIHGRGPVPTGQTEQPADLPVRRRPMVPAEDASDETGES